MTLYEKISHAEGLDIDSPIIMVIWTIIKLVYLASGIFAASIIATFPELRDRSGFFFIQKVVFAFLIAEIALSCLLQKTDSLNFKKCKTISEILSSYYQESLSLDVITLLLFLIGELETAVEIPIAIALLVKLWKNTEKF